MLRGKYIAIEGGNGAGLSTQVSLLTQKLKSEGIEVVSIEEPGGTVFAQKLSGLIKSDVERSTKTNVLAFNASRAETIRTIEEKLAAGIWVVADRCYLSTIVYQGYGEGQSVDAIRQICEYAIGKTQPDQIIVLEAGPEVASARLEKRIGTQDYFDDMNSQFHDRIREGYRIEAESYGHPIINAEGSKEQVLALIWKSIEPLLKKVETHTANRFLEKTETGHRITARGKRELSKYITNSEGKVYAFKSSLTQATVAAAMARLSRRREDMRVILLDEFIDQDEKDQDLLKRIITAYGDDSVQQLAGIHIIVESASNLLTKKLEWGRLASYLEQSTRYIYFDQKDGKGNYSYFTPSTLDTETKTLYARALDAIFDSYSQIVHTLTNYIQQNSTAPQGEQDTAWRAACRAQACDAARPLLPVATKSTVGIFASGQAIESLVMHLLSEDNHEAQGIGQSILDEARKVIPAFLERADKPDRGGAIVAYRANTRHSVRDFTDQYLPKYSGEFASAQLVDVTMRNELDLVPYMLYESSNLSLEEIKKEVDSWPIERKFEALNRYIGERLNRRHKPGRALEHMHYTWDIVCDYGIFRDLQRHRMVDAIEWQALTPRYGYDVPKLVEDAGMAELFEACFDASLELYNTLVERGYTDEAQYATLLGHRMRWKITFNAREAFHLIELRTSPQGHPGYRKLAGEMYQRISEIHPTLAQAMKFVNRDEDPELTRLAAERYTQFKLNQLDRKIDTTEQGE